MVAALLAGPQPIPIVTAGNTVLRRPAEPYDGQLGDDLLSELIEAMRVCMHEAPGVGLAAPQIGIPLQIAVLEDPATIPPELAAYRHRYPLDFRVIVNPRYTAVGTERAAFYEGCLSVPGYQAVVDRPASVLLECLDENGTAVQEQFDGWSARIVQHETDHLGGTLYLDKALTRSLTDNDQYTSLWGGLPITVARSGLGF
ncbi:peptide deformylase [Nakamurella silvestris]|nr:peptide deformylase [Nakamurella silvestris]